MLYLESKEDIYLISFKQLTFLYCYKFDNGLLCVLQAAIRPPTFVFFVNDAKLFPDTYRRYMEKQLRADAGFSGTPIRLLWRSRRKTERQDEG